MPVRGPRLKILRRLGTPLPGLTRKLDERASSAAPQRTARRARRTRSVHAHRLEETQKVRLNYGVSARQLRRYLEAARGLPGRTGENLLVLLERRMDNVVFRLGLAPTVPAARQLVSHGHVRVDGRRVDRPGYLLRIGETVDLAPRARLRLPPRMAAEQVGAPNAPAHLCLVPDDPCAGRMVSAPARSDVPFLVREALVIEYHRR